jgi:nicotinamide phosphoribosyltransferase
MIEPTIQTDFYKVPHFGMYPKGTIKISSNLTPRKSRIDGVNEVVIFGIQYFLKEYLIRQWNENFFSKPKEEVISKYKRMVDFTLGEGSIGMEHVEKLHDLGYLPIRIKSLPEGSKCPIRVPCCTITNTVNHAYWLVNYFETIFSTSVWQGMTSATIAYEYRKILEKYAMETVGNKEFVDFQAHDFSMRGMSSLESACISGAGHLTSFYGTDTIPAISWLEQYYQANVEKELVGTSVPATEHSVMTMYGKGSEKECFERLMDLYPKGILSVVSDTWNLWDVCTVYLPELKEKVMAREGKLVIRPDSGDPVDIICGTDEFVDKDWMIRNVAGINYDKYTYFNKEGKAAKWHATEGESTPERTVQQKGVIELLWEEFGGTVNELGYKVLDPHVGAIYGDSITLQRAKDICERLKAKGFASTNIVLGIGSYTYQYNTRDTFGFAIKATYGEVMVTSVDEVTKKEISFVEQREIFKDPITDDGTKKSAKGLLAVFKGKDGKYFLKDQCTHEEENTGELKVVFEDGKLIKDWSLSEVRNNLKNGI